MWQHIKKYRGIHFKSSSVTVKDGDTIFVLTSQLGPKREIQFQSWQQAKKQGWVKKDVVLQEAE